MASYRAVATGNFSNVAIWNVWNGSAWVAASVIPSSADDVWANNFIITIDQNTTVLTIRNRNSGAPGTGNISGGGFQIITGGIILTCINTIINSHLTASVFLLTVNHSSGAVTINASCVISPIDINYFRFLSILSNQTVNLVGNYAASQNGGGASGLLICNAPATINHVGNLFCNSSTAASSNNNTLVFSTGAAGFTYNLTGNCYYQILNTTMNGVCAALRLDVTGTVNIVGQVYNSSEGTGVFSNAIISTQSINLNITGNITGGQTFTQLAVNISGATAVCNIVGDIFGGNAGNSGSGGQAIQMTGANSITKLQGSIFYGNYGSTPINATRLFLIDNTSRQTDYASNSTNGALFPAAPPTRMTMYSPDTIADSPVPANVRQGTTYALGSQTGTLIVPSPSNVRKDIPTDNTVGTADLTAEDFLNAIETSSNDVAVRLRNVATVASTGGQLASYNV